MPGDRYKCPTYVGKDYSETHSDADKQGKKWMEIKVEAWGKKSSLATAIETSSWWDEDPESAQNQN
nr:uncharacterized protein CI109_005682 [Kwoniella shandongensis]KAA5525935.1 hypothetical protein CI109_005682 [Kwoniella shandongensis]